MQAYSRAPTPQINPRGNNHIAAPGLNQHIPNKGDANMNKVAVMPNSYETENVCSHFNPKQIDILKNYFTTQLH